MERDLKDELSDVETILYYLDRKLHVWSKQINKINNEQDKDKVEEETLKLQKLLHRAEEKFFDIKKEYNMTKIAKRKWRNNGE